MDYTTAAKKIRKILRDDDRDAMAVLSEIDKVLVKVGYPHEDPVYGMDPDEARVFLSYLVLAGRDWMPEDVDAIQELFDADDDDLDHPEGSER